MRRARSVCLLAPLADNLAAWHTITRYRDQDHLVFPRPDGTLWSDDDWRN